MPRRIRKRPNPWKEYFIQEALKYKKQKRWEARKARIKKVLSRFIPRRILLLFIINS